MEFSFASLDPTPWSAPTSPRASNDGNKKQQPLPRNAPPQMSVATVEAANGMIHSSDCGHAGDTTARSITGSDIAIMTFQASKTFNSQCSDGNINSPTAQATTGITTSTTSMIDSEHGTDHHCTHTYQPAACTGKPYQHPVASSFYTTPEPEYVNSPTHSPHKLSSPTLHEKQQPIKRHPTIVLEPPEGLQGQHVSFEERQASPHNRRHSPTGVPRQPAHLAASQIQAGRTFLPPPPQALDPVNILLGNYQLSNKLPMAIAERTSQHMQHIQQYQLQRQRLQALQAGMLQDSDAAQWHTAGGPPFMHDAGGGGVRAPGVAPSMARFKAPGLLKPGAYVSNGDYRFAGSVPLRSQPTASLLFERHGCKDNSVPSVQRFYLRPDKPSRPMSPPAPPQRHREPCLPTRQLPNGIPLSRLKTEQTARRVAAISGSMEIYEQLPLELLVYDAGKVCDVKEQNDNVEGGSAAQGLNLAIHDAMSALNAPSNVSKERHTASGVQGTANQGSIGALMGLGGAGQLDPVTAEPILDDSFAEIVKSHFHNLAEQQTQKLQKRLNASLPSLLNTMGVSADTLKTGNMKHNE